MRAIGDDARMVRSPGLPVLAVVLLAAAITLWVTRNAGEVVLSDPTMATELRGNATGNGAVVAMPELKLVAESLATEATARAEVGPAPFVATPEAEALLVRAATDRSLALVTAEVLAVGRVETASVVDGLQYQSLDVRVLATAANGPRLYATLRCPLCPSVSTTQFGTSTPFGAVQVGQVRMFVLGRGRPDLGAFGAILADRAYWIVLAGPIVDRPDDALLADVPPEFLPHLGRPLVNVFRGRVRALQLRDENLGKGRLRATDRIDVDVVTTAHLGGRLPLSKTVRIAQAPFAPGLDLTSLRVGQEFWFVTDEATLWQVLRAFAPVR